MTRVYLVRHGEAEGNLYRRAQGQYDGRITPLGEKQLDLLAERFRDVPLGAVYSSDLSRAVQTAQSVARFHPELTPMQDPRLRELHLGIWEDQPWGNVERDVPEQLYYFNNEPDKWQVPEAERFSDLAKRLRAAVLELAAKHDGDTIALCSHGMAIRTLQMDSLAREGRSDPPGHGDNTCVSLLEVEGEAIHVAVINDASHLPRELSTLARQDWWKHEGCGELNNMRVEPLVLPEEQALYLACYEDAWRFAHGSLTGFTAQPYIDSALVHQRQNARAIAKFLRGDELAGVVELDTNRFFREGVGWITLLYLTPEMRRRGLAPQLLGHAVSVYRALGRKALRLHVSVNNPTAIAFYERNGFHQLRQEQGVVAPLLLMEMPL